MSFPKNFRLFYDTPLLLFCVWEWTHHWITPFAIAPSVSAPDRINHQQSQQAGKPAPLSLLLTLNNKLKTLRAHYCINFLLNFRLRRVITFWAIWVKPVTAEFRATYQNKSREMRMPISIFFFPFCICWEFESPKKKVTILFFFF